MPSDPYLRLEALGVRTRRSNYAEVLLTRARENGRLQELEAQRHTSYLRQTGVHGAQGEFFDDAVELTATEPPYPRMSAVHVWSTSYGLIAIQAEYENGWRASKHGDVSESESAHTVFRLEDGEFLAAVSGMYGIVINSLQFHTTTGRTSELFGFETDGLPFHVAVPEGRATVALVGRTQGQLSSLGLTYLERAETQRDTSRTDRSSSASPLPYGFKGHTPLPAPTMNHTYLRTLARTAAHTRKCAALLEYTR